MSKLCGLNVVQLREKLQKRSLVTSGNKEVLVARLREALIDEGKNPDEFKFDGADEDNEISTGTFTTAKMMELLLKELKHVKLELAEQIEEQSTRIEMIEQKLDRQTVEVDHKIDKLKRELEQSKKMAMPLDHASGRTLKLRNRTQRSGESIQQLAQDIERLTLLSYPTSDPEHRDETALDTFIKALRDSELKQSLLLSDKRKLKDAVAHIHEECSCQKVVVKREPQQHGVPQCWICGEKDHLRRDCKHRLKDNYCRNCATRWRKRREDDRVSRSAPSNKGAEKLIRANFLCQRLASRIDAPGTVINVSRLHRNRNDLWLNGKVDQRECVITVDTGATKSILRSDLRFGELFKAIFDLFVDVVIAIDFKQFKS
ncbi:hypothetical protein HELRODRAFT_175920 [Helobdella robusta]|uniref:CCHC-type domain-containing protein n=2 Tax=Helobdella robusta TaxID=6412 RepID=T1F9W2_HELRO|nr:hypothetical protein HELRODRAFT_175920 [Helobdella robusta]ESO00480.1 hypothetical protein HELRODRAFT_175920 [Helobdella robusta]